MILSFGEIPEKDRDGDDQFIGSVPADLAEKLGDLCRGAGATPAEGFYLAWALTLRTLNRMDDVAFTTITSGRDGFSMDVSELTGLFINPVPVRVTVGPTAAARQLLADLHRQATETKPYEFCPLGDIQQAVGSGIQLGGLLVSYENYSNSDGEDRLLKPALVREEHESGDVSVDAQACADGSLSVALSYDPARYRRAEMERVFALFLNFLRRLAELPETPAAKYPLLSEPELEEVLKLSRGESFAYDASGTWIDLFRERAG